MGGIPSKAQELESLCLALREHEIVFYLTTPGARRKGAPDLVVGSPAVALAVWLRRSEFAAELSVAQRAEVDKVVAGGWVPVIAYGAREALRELQRRGMACRTGDVYAFATARCG